MWNASEKKCVILIGIFFGFLVAPVLAQSEGAAPPYSLNAIIFESYLGAETEKAFDAIELPSDEFPSKFSQLFAPLAQPQTIQLPPGVVIPREPMFLDVYTFEVTAEQILKKKQLSRHNDMQTIDYKVKFLSWSKDRYQIELEGRYGDFKFNRISVEAAVDKTEIVRIRYSTSRTLYVALTPIDPEDQPLKGIIPPKAIVKPMPSYPSELIKANWGGRVLIRVLIDREGRIDRGKLLLIECPHYHFASNSLDVLLNQWVFKPGTKDGIPIDMATNIALSFFRRPAH